ncbi:hypothetical protein NE852_10335 [Rhizobium sp. Pop5]|uniref:hypothetical protein n=1 Tax=Rhizobium sp. Pop5 TaxID=1223565 RepID=UPI0002835FD0|nr:hypothetical protein [Rhizobium sp. Pop5]EJZ21543.1 hypothetical protein RCCGEPOP_09359 [Rhizobium sp. Pop5]UVD58548.1 hypothetical protein NE852_10335 [Rhizobium sp. Pop5]
MMRRLARGTSIAIAVVAAVFMLFAVVFAATGEAPAAMVFTVRGMDPAALPDGVAILRWDRGFAVVTGERADYIRALYVNGAFLVLPVRKGGCLAFRPASS